MEPIRKDSRSLYREYQRTGLINKRYVSVVTCREVLQYHDTLYFGEYQFILCELICHNK